MAWFDNYGRQYVELPGDVYHVSKPQYTYNISDLPEPGQDFGYTPYSDPELKRLEEKDSRTKRHIRVLRIVSRILAVLLSIGVVIPLSLTIEKFLRTRNGTYSAGQGESGRVWPENPDTTYTYVYFGVSVISLLTNALILASYLHSTHLANNIATVGVVWTTVVVVGNLAVWIAAVVIYNYGRQKVDDKWRDLWGWSCSSTAKSLQPFVGDIDYGKYCHLQDAANIIGIVQIGANALTLVIVIFMIRRRRTKKRLQSYQLDDAKEPLRR